MRSNFGEYSRRARRPNLEGRLTLEMRIGREIRSLEKKKNHLDKYYDWIDNYTKELGLLAVSISPLRL